MGVYRGHDMLNADTDYVRTAVVSFEPTYFALNEAVEAWMADQNGPIGPHRDSLRDAIENAVRDNADEIGLVEGDLTDDVDYAAMIEFEATNGD